MIVQRLASDWTGSSRQHAEDDAGEQCGDESGDHRPVGRVGRERRVELADQRRAALPEQVTEERAGQREHCRFGQEGVADGRPGRAERLEQADLGGALGDRDEHHIHHQNSGHR
jgi:hypothetical protein